MKITRININKAKLNTTDIISFIKTNINFIYLYSVLICGLIIGCASVSAVNNNSEPFRILTDTNNSFFQIFIKQSLIYLVVITTNFSMGLCCVGIPFISIVTLFSGVTGGIFISLALIDLIEGSQYLSFIKLIIPIILIEAVIIYSADVSVKMSERVIKSMFFGINSNEIIISYLTRYLVMLATSLGLSLISAIIIKT